MVAAAIRYYAGQVENATTRKPNMFEMTSSSLHAVIITFDMHDDREVHATCDPRCCHAGAVLQYLLLSNHLLPLFFALVVFAAVASALHIVTLSACGIQALLFHCSAPGCSGAVPALQRSGPPLRYTVNPIKLETGLRPNSAGSPNTLFLRIEAIGFPTFGLLL